MRLGDTFDVDGSEGVLSNPESHTFGLPVVGGAGSLLLRRAGMCAHALEGDPGRSSVQCHRRPPRRLRYLRVRDQLEGRWRHQSQGVVVRVRAARIIYHLRGNIRGHDYNRLTRLGHRVRGESNSRRRHRHCRRF